MAKQMLCDRCGNVIEESKVIDFELEDNECNKLCVADVCIACARRIATQLFPNLPFTLPDTDDSEEDEEYD